MGDGGGLEGAGRGVVGAAPAAAATFLARVLVHLHDGALVRDGVTYHQRRVPQEHPGPRASPHADHRSGLHGGRDVARPLAGCQRLLLRGQLHHADVHGLLLAVAVRDQLAGAWTALPLPRALAGLPVDADVGEDHEKERQVEGPDSGVEGVPYVLGDLTLFGVQTVLRGPPAEEWRHGDAHGVHPHDEDEQESSLQRSSSRVAQRLGDGVVAVVADGAEVGDGGGAADDVHEDPEVAEVLGEDPLAVQLVGQGDGRDQRAH